MRGVLPLPCTAAECCSPAGGAGTYIPPEPAEYCPYPCGVVFAGGFCISGYMTASVSDAGFCSVGRTGLLGLGGGTGRFIFTSPTSSFTGRPSFAANFSSRLMSSAVMITGFGFCAERLNDGSLLRAARRASTLSQRRRAGCAAFTCADTGEDVTEAFFCADMDAS